MESFNGKLRDELLDREVFYTLLEVQVLTEQYRQTYNRFRRRPCWRGWCSRAGRRESTGAIMTSLRL